VSVAPGTRLGSYEITGPLGAGGMGEVYRAKDVRVDRAVALKVLPEEFFEDEERRGRFEREAKLLASLNHPGVATLFSFEEISGRHVLSMELVEGEDLGQRLASGPLPVDEALAYAKQMAEALEAAHEKGIVHRDLKPANVKVTPEGRVKLLDFGLAKIFEADPTGSSPSVTRSPTLTARATAAGVILGTAAYMSPEQARGKTVEKRTDVWAFGCVLYEMLTGKRAFEGETVSDTLAAVLMKEPDWSVLPEGTPEKVKEILRKSLRREAKARLHDIADARLDFEELGTPGASGTFNLDEKAAVPSSAVDRNTSAMSTRGSRKFLWIAWGLLAAFAAAAGALALRGRPPQTPAVLRSTIILPAGLRFRDDNHAVALSRDGKRLAFAATDREGRTRLWVRSTDSLSAQALDGTEGAVEPFWSPDGRHLGFFADRRLKRVPAAGGTVQTVCEAADPRGGSWGEGDVIVFSPNPFGGLQQVSASGGAPVPVTTTSGKGMTHRLPVFLPDGKRLLFFQGLGLKSKENGVFCLDLATKKVTRVSAENSGVLVAPGALVFSRNANLMAQPFDADRLALSGEAVTLAEKVWFNGYRWTLNAGVSDTGLLVVRPGAAASKSQLTWMDLDGRVLGKVGPPAAFAAVDVSPDGRRALAVLAEETGLQTLWMYDLERGVPSRFAADMDASDARWSPDGRQVAYSDVDGNLYLKATDGLSAARLVLKVEESANQRPTSFTADGATLVFDRQEDAGWDLLTVALSGDPAVRPLVQTASNETLGRISPDGQWLALLSDETGRSEAYVRPFPKGERRQITSGGADELFWLGRSGELAWIRDGRVQAVAMSGPDAAKPRGLLGGLTVETPRAVAPSPDGKRLLVALPVDAAAADSLTLIANWPTELAKK